MFTLRNLLELKKKHELPKYKLEEHALTHNKKVKFSKNKNKKFIIDLLTIPTV